ncbi:MAG: chorismate mutase [Pseudomonadota bacterium]|nr:chorismate mutase [Pseudomonadota bacterium]
MADEATASLDRLRQDIDRIDRELHALLRERAAVVKRIGLAKRAAGEGNVAFVRPGREADVVRAILERHDGALPRAVVARIWREIISAACQMQASFRVAMYDPERALGHWDLVRNHFGSTTPVVVCGSAQRVLQELTHGNTIGVLPYPEFEEQSPWWPLLAFGDAESARVVGLLPFYESNTGHYESRRMLVVATYPPEPSEADRGYIVVSVDPELSRNRLSALMDQSGMKGSIVASKDAQGDIQQLLEIDGFVTKADPRLADLLDRADGMIRRVVVIGAAARPVGMLDAG